MTSILHVTPHLGGGVGRVLLNYLAHILPNDREQHALICLDYANANAAGRAASLGIPLDDRMSGLIPALLGRMAEADIVVLHWWNHPLIYSLLVREELPPTRLLLWSHVSGLFPTQNFTDELLAFPDLFVVASPVSFDAQAIQRIGMSERRDRVRLVFTCAGIEHVASASPLPHEGFRIGYVGTVDYCKMHPHFVQMSAAADIPAARFVVCGGPNEAAVRQDAVCAGVANLFDFLGQVNDVASQLSAFDVFGYPLAPYHYGTGEQALIEALAVGIPPVVLDNGAEQHVVEDGVTGIVAHDERAYTHALEELHRRPDFRRLLSENARSTARSKFTIENLAGSWSALYEDILQKPKRHRHWSGTHATIATAAEVFLASLGEYGSDYVESMTAKPDASVFAADDRIANGNELFRSKTRGSVFHYQEFFPDDPWLSLWCGLIQLNEGDCVNSFKNFTAARAGINQKRVAPYLERIKGRV